MDEKEELFVEGKEGEEDLLDFEFEELTGDVSELNSPADVSFDEEILELTDIIKPGDIGENDEAEKSTGNQEFEFDPDILDADSIDFDDEEDMGQKEEIEELSLGEEDSSLIGDEKAGQDTIDFEFDQVFEKEEKQEGQKGAPSGIDTGGQMEDQDYQTGSFDGDLNEIPEIDERAVEDIGGGVGVEELQQESISDLEELTEVGEGHPENESQALDLGAMIDEIEKEEIEAESEEIPLDQIAEELGAESEELPMEGVGEEIEAESDVIELDQISEEIEEVQQAPTEDIPAKTSTISDDLVPESIELDSLTDLSGIDEEKLEKMIKSVVTIAVEKAVKETMSGTAERVIRETIEALKSSMESPEK